MDDNKVLTLVSKDRILLTPPTRLLFEIANLRNATPATVSRGGVLFINESDIGWTPYMNAWLERSQKKMTVKKEGMLGNMPICPTMDEVAKSVFYRCFGQYFE
jgi:dynein heavy chain